MPIKNLITFRKGTYPQWSGLSQPLASGEPGYDITNNILKIGDGVNLWNDLSIVNTNVDSFSIDSDKLDSSLLNINSNNNTIFDVGNHNHNNAYKIIFSANNELGIPLLRVADDQTYANKSIFSAGNFFEHDLVIKKNGNVGLGIEFPNSALEVNGSIYAKDGLVASGSLSTNGSLFIRNGTINVNDDNGPYSTTISSSGLKVNYTTNLTEVDLVDLTRSPTPTGWFNNFYVDTRDMALYFPRGPRVGEKVLLRNFSDKKNNGVYQLQQVYNSGDTPIENLVTPTRVSPYANNATITNLSRVKNKYDNSVYILNLSSNGGSSTVGTSNLVFTQDPGEQVMTIQSTRDVDFVASISATAKYFRIKHPDPESEYSVLQYGSLESPYNGVRLTGTGQLKKGICKVQLPSYIKYLISEQNMNVQLTNKGHHKILYIDDIDLPNNCFTVKGYRAKTGGPFEFFWTFTGTRKDVDPLIVEH